MPSSRYWPGGGEAQRAHGRRRQFEWCDQQSKALSRKKLHAKVRDEFSAVLAIPNDEGMPAPPHIYLNRMQRVELESSSDSFENGQSEHKQGQQRILSRFTFPLLYLLFP